MIYLFIFTFLATGSLLMGVLSMALGKKYNKKFGTKLMSFRVIFQAIAILSLAIIYLFS